MERSLKWTCIWAWILTVTECSILESQVTCTFSQDCVLPCTFEPADNANITWYQQDVPVLSYSLGMGQEKLLSQRFMGRASLFGEQVTSGNASLEVKKINTQDRGRYVCSVTINKTMEYVIIMRVEAPIKVLTLETMLLGDNEVAKCSARDIYPAPHLSWATDPPLQKDILRPTTRKTADELGLYSVESKLNLVRNAGYTYICTISTSYGSQTWTALLRDEEMTITKGSQLTIPCIAPRNLHNFILTWNFTTEGKSSVIFTFNSQTWQVSNHWEGRAHVDPDRAATGDGSLQLQNLDSSPHVGMFTCTFSNLRAQYLVHNRVNITSVSGERVVKGRGSKVWLTSIVVAAVSLCIITVWCLKKKGGFDTAKDTGATELQSIKPGHPENGTPPEHRRLTADANN